MPNLFDTTKAQSKNQAQANIETRDGTVKKVYSFNGNSNAADVLLDGETNVLRKVPNTSGGQLSVNVKVKVNFSKGSRFDAQIIGGGDSSSGGLVAASSAGTTSSTATPAPADLSQHPFLTYMGDEALTLSETLAAGANIQQTSSPASGTGDTFVPALLAISSVDALLSTLPNPAAAFLPDGVTPMVSGLRVEIRGTGGAPDTLYRLDTSQAPAAWRQIGGAGGGAAPPAAGTGVVFVEEETPAGAINGGNTAYTIIEAPNAGTFQLFVNGIRQRTSLFGLDGTNLTIYDAPQPGDELLCFYEYGAPASRAILSFVQDETPGGTIDGVNTAFTLVNVPAARTFELFVNGLRQRVSMFSQGDTDLLFVDAPQPGDDLACFYEFGTNTSDLIYVNREVLGGAIDGVNQVFTLQFGPAAGTESLYLDGVLQQAGAAADYTLFAQSATFNTPPPAGSLLLGSYYH